MQRYKTLLEKRNYFYNPLLEKWIIAAIASPKKDEFIAHEKPIKESYKFYKIPVHLPVQGE